jgi:hypothetical protein
LIVDADARSVEHHTRGDDGTWRRTVIVDGDVALAGVSIRVPLAEIFADLPA